MANVRSILVTGGVGFLGAVIVRKLLEQFPQCRIIVLDKSASPGNEQSPRLEYYQADVTIPEEVNRVFRATNPDAVIHTAGLIPPLSERHQRRLEKKVFNVNVNGTMHVLNAAKDACCSAFIYTSSCCACTDDLSGSYANIDETWPVSPVSSIYGESKVRAEKLVLAAQEPNFATCILRPSVIFGENDDQLIPSIHACIAKGETPFKIGSGLNLWDTDYVGNVADAHILALINLFGCQTASGEIFFIQNNQPVPFRDICLEVWKCFQHVPPYEIMIPESLGWIMGSLSELYSWLARKPTTLSRGSVMDACSTRYASGRKARRILGHQPKVGLEEGLRISCEVSHSSSPICSFDSNSSIMPTVGHDKIYGEPQTPTS